jgi:hypothetical protein
MQNFLSNNRIGALMTILVLSVGSLTVVATTHIATASQIGKLCVFFACGNANITGGSSTGGGQPTPNTATLTVTKKVDCLTDRCRATVDSGNFHITVTGDNPSPSSFVGNADGTKVTLGAGTYNVDEDDRCANSQSVCITADGITFQFDAKFSLDCTGSINAGETKECVITNTQLT